MKLLRQTVFFIACAAATGLTSFGFQPPPAPVVDGWQSLFDGKTLTGWKHLGDAANFRVENGAIVGTTAGGASPTSLVTEQEYGDFVLELDVRLDSSRSTAGVLTRAHFDESAAAGWQVALDPSARRWSGGVYDEGRRQWLYPLDLHPAAKAAFRVGQYNHVRVECLGKELKTWINHVPAAYVVGAADPRGFVGLLVPGSTAPAPAGQKVYFKNIRIKTANWQPTAFPAAVYVANFVPNYLTTYEKQDGWQLLFDGKSPAGWRSARGPAFPTQGWQVTDGTLTVEEAQGKEAANGGDIITDDEYGAFDFSFEFKLTPGANSGMIYFVTLAEKTQGSAIGLEYQVLDDARHPDAKLGHDGDRALASLYDLIGAVKPPASTRPIGEWNVGRVVVSPTHHVEHYLNGVKVLAYERDSPAFRALVAQSKYHVWPHFAEAPQGHLLLQDHGNQVAFRSLKLKKLK